MQSRLASRMSAPAALADPVITAMGLEPVRTSIVDVHRTGDEEPTTIVTVSERSEGPSEPIFEISESMIVHSSRWIAADVTTVETAGVARGHGVGTGGIRGDVGGGVRVSSSADSSVVVEPAIGALGGALLEHAANAITAARHIEAS